MNGIFSRSIFNYIKFLNYKVKPGFKMKILLQFTKLNIYFKWVFFFDLTFWLNFFIRFYYLIEDVVK